MYTRFPVINNILPEATNFIIYNDRYKYIDAYYIIESSINKKGKGVLIGGPMAQSILTSSLNDKSAAIINKDSFSYEIYIENPFEYAKELAQEIYKGIESKRPSASPHPVTWWGDTINVETNIINKIYTIWIDMRQIVRVIGMERYRDKVEIASLVEPLMKPSLLFPDISLPLIAPEVLLIDIYQKLYNPYPSGGKEYRSYIQLLAQESRLYPLVFPEIEDGKSGSAEKFINIDKKIRAHLPEIIEALKDKMILIGDYARQGIDINTVPSGNQYRLQILSGMPPDDIAAIINNILNLPLKTVKFNIHLPVDIYIKKYIIYCQNPNSDDGQVPVCEIFNSPEYELISTLPTSAEGVRRAGLAAQIRFRLIDIWVLLIIRGLNISHGRQPQHADAQIAKSRKEIMELRAQFYKTFEDAAAIFETFPTEADNYFGQYIDEGVRRKMIVMVENKGKRFPRYFPK